MALQAFGAAASSFLSERGKRASPAEQNLLAMDLEVDFKTHCILWATQTSEINFDSILNICVWVFCLQFCLCAMCLPDTCTGQKRASNPSALNDRQV